MPKYLVNWQLEHDGKTYLAGEEVELKDGSALIANGTLSEIAEAPKQAAKKTGGAKEG